MDFQCTKYSERRSIYRLIHLNGPELFELGKTSQVHAHSITCWECNKNEHRFSCGRCFTKKAIIVKPLDLKFSNDEKQDVLTCRNTLLRQVKSYIGNK